jgi:hypothetical protein
MAKVFLQMEELDNVPPPGTSRIYSCRPVESSMYIELYMSYNKKHQRDGYFVVGWELISRLYLSLLSYGYRIPNRDHKDAHRIRPDKSVQRAFHKFLHQRCQNTSPTFISGEIIDAEDESPLRINHYHNKYLPDFVEFFESQWLRNTAPTYFKTRDRNALPYLRKLTCFDPSTDTVDQESLQFDPPQHSDGPVATNASESVNRLSLEERCREIVMQARRKRYAA